MRAGIGYDVHKLVEGRDLILGGVKIEYEKGLLGHSDADVLLHAIMDALLGAAALGDIGQHFPDTDERYRGISSIKLLEHVGNLLEDSGFVVENIDSVIVAQRPKMADHIPAMRENIARALGILTEQVSVKATTEEGLGFTGSGEGISAQAVCSLASAEEYLSMLPGGGCGGDRDAACQIQGGCGGCGEGSCCSGGYGAGESKTPPQTTGVPWEAAGIKA